MRLGRVFVSSVFGGLLDLRQVVAEAARLAGLEAVLAEHHVAQAGAVKDALVREIGLCDIYVGLFDRRRGTVPPKGTTDKRAITEEELRTARELGLRCLVFLSKAKGSKREPGLAEFLAAEVTEYESGVWTRPYTRKTLRRELVAALSAVKPKVVLALARGDGGLEATVHLAGVQPAWKGKARIGPVMVDLSLPYAATATFDAFRAGSDSRGRLSEAELESAGQALGRAAIPGSLGAALDGVLDLAAASGRLVTLVVRTGDPAALGFPWELLSLPRHPLPVREGLAEIVRRIPHPGDDADPARDPAPSVPPPHLSVLAFTAAPVEDLQIAAGPGAEGFADADLFWEREQERLMAAFEDLLSEGRGHLSLPDTGDTETLRRQLALRSRPGLVHISRHGGAAVSPTGTPLPVLFLEDGDGRRAPESARDLLSWARATPGAASLELVVLAACSTAGAPAQGRGSGLQSAAVPAAATRNEAAGLAEALVDGGLARVLGMQSTISDEGATAFTEAFYRSLARGTDLPAALRAGRVELAAAGRKHEWAVPTLLVRGDAGPLAAPEGSALPPADVLTVPRRAFQLAGISYLDAGYVGRRDAERKLGRAFDRGEPVLVIHGLGGMGKSTLASHFLQRRQDQGARLLRLHAGRRLAPERLLDEVAALVKVSRPAHLPLGEAELAFRNSLSREFGRVEPTMLYLDNFEDNQDEEGAFLDPGLGEAVADLAGLGRGGFRLLITSRVPVRLPGAHATWNLDLGELPASSCRKLRLLDPQGLGKLRPDSWTRVLQSLGGHPKSLELLGAYVRSGSGRAETLLASFEEAMSQVDTGLAETHQLRGRRLLVDTVLAQVPAERLPAFDRLCLLCEPFSTGELVELLAADGVAPPEADLAWLRSHGLLATPLDLRHSPVAMRCTASLHAAAREPWRPTKATRPLAIGIGGSPITS
jgi:hypothetical protein